MKNAVGKSLSLEEVKALPDNTKIFVESKFPIEHAFLGIKEGAYIKNNDGEIRWAIAMDFEVLCKAYEWKPKSELTPIERLFSNIKIYQNAGILEEEFGVFATENPEVGTIEELCDIMETEMSYWEA